MMSGWSVIQLLIVFGQYAKMYCRYTSMHRSTKPPTATPQALKAKLTAPWDAGTAVSLELRAKY